MQWYYALLKDDPLASVWKKQWKNGLKTPCCFSALEFKEIHDTAVVSDAQILTPSSSKDMVGTYPYPSI